MHGLLGELARWITDAIYSFGYVGIFVMVTLGNLHLPVPTQITLPFAGFLVGQGQFSFTAVMVSSSIAAILVSLVFYFLGLWVGEEGMRRLVGWIERFELLFESDYDKVSGMFERHGGKAIFIGHLIPGIGAFISIPAGLKHMPIFGRFMLYTILGCIVYNAAHVALGWVLGSQWTVVKQYSSVLEYVVLALIVGVIVGFVWRRWRAHK
jgi:membrane protein DedA with SNARE-associated domain